MKLKTVSAPTIVDAMQQVRQTLGDEAVIVSSLRLPSGGIQLVVATEEKGAENKIRTTLAMNDTPAEFKKLQSLLTLHRVPPIVIERLMQSVRHEKTGSITDFLTKAFEQTLTFSPVGLSKTNRAFMMTGIPGSGKTIALVKWAVRAVMDRLKVSIITLDTQKGGATAQLAAFTTLLKTDLTVADIKTLPSVIQTERQKSDLILIDSPGLNPWLATDMALLAEVSKTACGIEPVMVMPAGLDSIESGEIADHFARLGCSRMIATKLDISQTYGNILNAALSGGLALAYYTANPAVTDALHPCSAEILTDLLCHTQLTKEIFS